MIILLLLFFGLAAGDPLAQLGYLVFGVLEFHYEGWLLFAAVMRVKQVRDLHAEGKGPPLSRTQRVLSYTTLAIAFPWDVVLNIFASLYFWEPPFRPTARGHLEASVIAMADVGRVRKLFLVIVNFLRNRQWLLSQRLEWHVYHTDASPRNWRRRRALSFRMELLDNIDPKGVHRA